MGAVGKKNEMKKEEEEKEERVAEEAAQARSEAETLDGGGSPVDSGSDYEDYSDDGDSEDFELWEEDLESGEEGAAGSGSDQDESEDGNSEEFELSEESESGESDSQEHKRAKRQRRGGSKEGRYLRQRETTRWRQHASANPANQRCDAAFAFDLAPSVHGFGDSMAAIEVCLELKKQ